MPSSSPNHEKTLLDALDGRVGKEYVQTRLSKERGYGFAKQGNYSTGRYLKEQTILRCAKGIFRLTGLYKRGLRNAKAIQLRTHTHRIPTLPKKLSGLRILQISDTHIDMIPENADTLSEMITGLEFDFAVHTGDFRDRSGQDPEHALALCKPFMDVLRTPLYSILGNHDLLRTVPMLEKQGARFLINESIPLKHKGETLWLSGIDDSYYFQTHDWEKTQRGIPPESFSILLAHDPAVAQQVHDLGYTFMLSGHTHGGQINLNPNRSLIHNSACRRELFYGCWKHKNLIGYTTSGVGCSGVPLRYHCPPEIVIHTLTR